MFNAVAAGLKVQLAPPDRVHRCRVPATDTPPATALIGGVLPHRQVVAWYVPVSTALCGSERVRRVLDPEASATSSIGRWRPVHPVAQGVDDLAGRTTARRRTSGRGRPHAVGVEKFLHGPGPVAAVEAHHTRARRCCHTPSAHAVPVVGLPPPTITVPGWTSPAAPATHLSTASRPQSRVRRSRTLQRAWLGRSLGLHYRS